MWIDPDIQEHELLRLRTYLEQNPFECPLTLAVLQKRLDEIREWRYQREWKRCHGQARRVMETPDLSSLA